MWRLNLAVRLLESLTMRLQTRMAELHIDDDVALALRLLRKSQDKAR